jgi:monofunctional biosynthetic peptidoglycan transglycosylase
MRANVSRHALRLIGKALLVAFVAALVLPFVLILPLNIMQPPTTAMIVARAVQRKAAGVTPAWPRRDVVPRDSISPYLRRAVLAAEDDRFYLHWGFDLVEIEEAIDRAQRGGRLRGASTITQQVAKNIFLWEGRSFVRKGYEAYLTLVLELCLSKDRILDLYLNLAEWGDGVFGAEAAARTHFGKSARALTAEEAARLAAVLPSPRRWSPFGGVASRRVPVILGTMSYAAPRERPPAAEKSR